MESDENKRQINQLKERNSNFKNDSNSGVPVVSEKMFQITPDRSPASQTVEINTAKKDFNVENLLKNKNKIGIYL